MVVLGKDVGDFGLDQGLVRRRCVVVCYQFVQCYQSTNPAVGISGLLLDELTLLDPDLILGTSLRICVVEWDSPYLY